jgi:hypothetical protein
VVQATRRQHLHHKEIMVATEIHNQQEIIILVAVVVELAQ